MRILQRKTYIDPPKETILPEYDFKSIVEMYILNDCQKDRFLIILTITRANDHGVGFLNMAVGIRNGKMQSIHYNDFDFFDNADNLKSLSKHIPEDFWITNTNEKFMIDLVSTLSLNHINALVKTRLIPTPSHV